ncbi:MAG: hypothetical protein KGQ58_01225 [Proteobacteria bacterium]|nr:hypothetical protein [Pseudomonadota bacterium]MDE3207648.1 hypothetical protein [Pseudomonadota bacterium]
MTTISSVNSAIQPVVSGEELVKIAPVSNSPGSVQNSEPGLAQNPSKAVIPAQPGANAQQLRNLTAEVNQLISKFANAGAVELAVNTSDAQNPTIQVLSSTRQVLRVVPAEEMMQIVQALNVLQGVLIYVKA